MTWQLKTDMKMERRRAAPAGDSGAGAMERTVPSAGERIVLSSPAGSRSGSRKNETRKTAKAPKTAAKIVCPEAPAAAARRRGGRMKTQPSRAMGILSARPPSGECARSSPCGP